MAAVLMILPCWQGCEFSSFPADDDGQAPDGYFEDALPDTGGVADSPADPGVPDVPVDTGVPDAPYAPDGPPPAVGDPFQGLGDGIRLMGRIWPMPNPIYIDLTQPEPSAVFVLENIGSEDVLADYMEIIGSPGFVFSDPASAATPHVIHGGGTDCTGAGGTGRGIRYEGDGDPGDAAVLRVVTSDPTSPTLEVPIILDPDGSHSLLYPSPESSPHVLTRPNPVRLPAGTGGTVDLCMSALSFEGGSVRMSGMDVVGEGLVLLGVWDSAGSLVDPASGLDLGYGYTISMGYGPESGDPWGYLRLHIENWWGDPITHAIPVFR